MGPAEQLLSDIGMTIGTIRIADNPGVGDDLAANPAILGILAVEDVIAGSSWHADVRPGLSLEQRERFAAWVVEKMRRYLEHGPEPDGWQARTLTSGWQLWCRQVQLPPV